MTTVKIGLRRGQAARDAAIGAGAAEAQTDTISLTIDTSRMAKGDVLALLGEAYNALVAGQWPPVPGGSTPPPAPDVSNTSITSSRSMSEVAGMPALHAATANDQAAVDGRYDAIEDRLTVLETY